MDNDSSLVQWANDLRTEMLAQQQADQVLAVLDREVRRLSFEYYACGIRHLLPFTRPTTEVIGSYPSHWLARYQAQDYARSDPALLHGLRSSEMVVWDDALFRESRQLWGEAREHGLRVGATLPLRTGTQTLSVLSVARPVGRISRAEGAMLRLHLRCLIEHAMQRLAELGHPMLSQPSITLSQRERQVLQWTADGKSSGEIALILDISINTVNFHLKAILKKFKATSKTLAAAHAAMLGLL
ncbi:autoinducer binding domain-containing protein [Pseudomonas putida]